MAFKDKMAATRGGEVSREIAAAMERKAPGGEISCADAENFACDMNVEMEEIGRSLDLLGIRIIRCQLGLFGYGEKKKIVTAAQNVQPDLQNAICTEATEKRLPCLTAWEIARRSSVPRMAVSSACEAMGFKIKPCQLGAF